MEKLVQVFEYEGRPMTAVMYKGRPAFIAKEIGERLGYSGTTLGDLIRREWSGEFVDGDDVIVVDGPELSDLKSVLQQTGEYTVSRARGIMLLFETGVHAVALLSRKPEAARLRKFLSSEVMPQLVRDGRFDPGRKVDKSGALVSRGGVGGELSVKDRVALMGGEARLLEARARVMNAETRMKSEVRKGRDQEIRVRALEVKGQMVEARSRALAIRENAISAKALRLAARRALSAGSITKSEYHDRLAIAAEVESGVVHDSPKEFRDAVRHDVQTCEQIGRCIGMTSQSVGRMISRMTLETGGAFRDNPLYAVKGQVTVENGGVMRDVPVWKYTPEGIRRIIEFSRSNGYGKFGGQAELDLKG